MNRQTLEPYDDKESAVTIQEQIKKDLMGAMKARDEDKKSTLRVIMGEFARADAKELSDDEVIKVLKKLIKSEKETLTQKGSRFLGKSTLNIFI